MKFEDLDRFFNDLEAKLNRMGSDGYRVVCTEKGIIDGKEHLVIIMEKGVE